MNCILASRFSHAAAAFCTSPASVSRFAPRGLTSISKPTSLSSRTEHTTFFGKSCLSYNLGHVNNFYARTLRVSRTPFHSFSTSRPPARQLIYAFDKAPTTLPDWWDDEDEEDTTDQFKSLRYENAKLQVAYDSGGGTFASNGGSGGNGRGEDENFNDEGGKPNEGIFAILMALYMRAMSRNPILTKAITTSVIAFLGDVLAQSLSQMGHEFQWDARRTLSIAAWGFFFMGPTLHYWFSTLDRLFTNKYSVLSKLITDQLLFAPFFNSAFMMGVGTLEGHSFKEVSENVKTKLWSAMKANWMLWPAAQFINFSYVPKNLQVVYVNCVALVWNMIFMYISHSKNEAVA